MRTRLLWALLLLAAVFSMHGLNCIAADSPTPTSTASGAHRSAHDAGGPSSIQAGTASFGAMEHAEVAASATAASSATQDHPAGHSTAMHALMVCLAVLAGGAGVVLAALAAWLARGRARAALLISATTIRVAVDRCRSPLLAPDLDRLCVLRI